jgi:hypothetical protein
MRSEPAVAAVVTPRVFPEQSDFRGKPGNRFAFPRIQIPPGYVAGNAGKRI